MLIPINFTRPPGLMLCNPLPLPWLRPPSRSFCSATHRASAARPVARWSRPSSWWRLHPVVRSCHGRSVSHWPRPGKEDVCGCVLGFAGIAHAGRSTVSGPRGFEGVKTRWHVARPRRRSAAVEARRWGAGLDSCLARVMRASVDASCAATLRSVMDHWFKRGSCQPEKPTGWSCCVCIAGFDRRPS